MKWTFHTLRLWKYPTTLMTFAIIFMTAAIYSSSQVRRDRIQALQLSDSTIQETPVIQVQPQQFVPLTITSIEVDALNSLSPRLTFSVTNISSKPILAFAISQDAASLDKQWSGNVTLTHLLSLSDLLQPSQAKSVVSAGFGYPESIKTITLSVDFVEFLDGTTWGNDIYKSAEELVGQRAGARFEKNRLLKMLKANGEAALLQAITAEEVEVDATFNGSSRWKEGFRSGVGVTRSRLRKASLRGGIALIERELQEPYDASEGRK